MIIYLFLNYWARNYNLQGAVSDKAMAIMLQEAYPQDSGSHFEKQEIK